MTHRNIELQVALPKVSEVAKIHQQLQQQHLNQQGLFEQVMQQKAERDLQRPVSPDENRAVANQEGQSGPRQRNRNEKRRKKERQQQETKHPYKGKNVDFRV
ncbi:hypothetical protein [Effusibacillus lacus]|uniref:Uncharacterized protein n=1 Tax=Effusibacillus lacus TaxID=1348429 RepID=A0A292YPY7_9BACL|nr:hypothetical protein [Effusibacillus lacus]TCS73147.1 hypothetical protein EDD64_11926 [Effusibacillus lacus]GAX90550.1 hypothetical protein EFBL_2177 [Effusibacillus lacus]